jgi:hypothetical protein
MRRWTMSLIISLAVFAVPLVAQACIQLVPVWVSCIPCGDPEQSLSCASGYSQGFNSCNNFGQGIPCQARSGGCEGVFYVAVGYGNCKTSAAVSGVDEPVVLSSLVPTARGGYRETLKMIPVSSCVEQGGERP